MSAMSSSFSDVLKDSYRNISELIDDKLRILGRILARMCLILPFQSSLTAPGLIEPWSGFHCPEVVEISPVRNPNRPMERRGWKARSRRWSS